MIASATTQSQVVSQLEEDGIVIIHDLVDTETLRAMQAAFEARLERLRWNDFDGFEMTERHRHMVQDVLTLEQGFVDVALNPVITSAVGAYVGDKFELTEAKGWRSLPTRKDFHGWHGDAWYDQTCVDGIPREVKLALYLTDVNSGAFQYIKGTHGRQAPRSVRADEVRELAPDRIVEANGPAGTVILFDTSGIHRQSVPILEPRNAVFYAYHDPRIPLQKEDILYNRYHPLLLNAAFLGDLSDDDMRILGFGNKANYIPAYARGSKHAGLQTAIRMAFGAKLRLDALNERVAARLRKTFHRNGV
jgi:hypothetical protein